MRTKVFVLAVAFLLITAGPGCWDLRDIDEVAIIGAMGLDKGAGGKVVVSLEVINSGALALGSVSAASTSKVVAMVLRDEASTIAAAVANAQRRIPRGLITGQISTVICGQALAREGIGQYIDCLLRDAHIRRSAILSTCDTGAGLLQRPYIDPLPSRTLFGLTKNAVNSGKTTMVTLNEFAVKLADPGVEPITLHTVGRRTKDVQVKRQGEEVKQTEPAAALEQPIDVDVDMPSELPSDSPFLNPLKETGSGELMPGVTIDIGIAAYKGDKMVGLMDGYQARGYLWVVGRVKQSVIEVPDPNGSGQIVGFSVVRSSSSIKPVLGDKIRMDVEIHVDMEASQVPPGIDLKDPATVDQMESALKARINEEARSTLNRVQQELKTDIYGFGNKVYRKDPRLWSELEPRWNDEVFPELEVDLEIHARVRAPGSVFRLLER